MEPITRYIKENYVSKNKIKERIKQLEKLRETLTDSNGMIEISSSIDTLQELLEE